MKSPFSLHKGRAFTKRNKLSYSLLFISSLVAAALTLSGCSQPQEEQKEMIRPVKLFQVEDSNAGNLRQFPAKVYASEEAEISFRIPGELVKFPVKQAEEVKKGQLLAKLDDRDIRNELAARQADYDLAEAENNRIKSLRKKKVVSQSELDNSNAKLKSAQAALQLANDKLKYTVLKAPFDGRVAQTLVENYQFAQAQQTILILQGSNTLDVSIQVPESIVSNVREENIDRNYQPVATFAGRPGTEYRVTYKEHSTKVTPGTQSYEVVFTMPIPEDLTVYPGMGATLTLDLSKVSPRSNAGQHFVVPLSAVLKDDATGKEQVWVFDQQNNTVNPVEVTVGTIFQSGIEVTSGLKEGDRIVSAGVNRLRSGMAVKPLQRERGL
ncbi:efflux RND transporter periplasmic adaptor subunit [Endozoicomonas numazuensis]|uniref:efflux RND transporter periplasmic adaptor subunit n=1 Tax=Endozoicomonas numazuensis TaxID=1137799 RepID=UPI00068EF51F|nr:efflux RND transporter periplasmic adaptor subunit [Endozoicomonas numazuensis]